MPPDTLRVLVCGSRTFRDGDVVKALLWGLVHDNTDVTVIHGCAKGADSLAGFYAQWFGLQVEEYPALWALNGKRAGFIRNRQMLDEGKPDVVYAFVDKPLAESKGTAMMVDLAHGACVPTFVIQAIVSAEVSPSGGHKEAGA